MSFPASGLAIPHVTLPASESMPSIGSAIFLACGMASASNLGKMRSMIAESRDSRSYLAEHAKVRAKSVTELALFDQMLLDGFQPLTRSV